MIVPTERSHELQEFLQTLEAGIVEGAATGSAARAVVGTIMDALRTPRTASTHVPVRLPLCDLIEPIADTLAGGVNAHAHARALAALAPRLAWWRRPNTDDPNGTFFHGHANATVIGKGGLEERDDVWVGISLMAPDVDYPEHHHPPEEVYLVLSPGHWQQDGGDWHEPGVGGVVHNVPNIRHAMRSGSRPLLATWCLWRGNRASVSVAGKEHD